MPVSLYYQHLQKEQKESLEESETVHWKANTSKAMLPKNHSLLADLGSYINVIGRNTLNKMKETAEANGRAVQMIPRKTRLKVNGVGSDPAVCDEEAVIPIAIKSEGAIGTTADNYHSNVADGCGVDLPAIMGNKSMKDKDAVIILREGKEAMAFPGPGGYKIEWSPGTKIVPMQNTQSGHMVLQCDHWDLLTNRNPEDSLTFAADHTKEH